MKQDISRNMSGINASAVAAANGLQQHETAIGLKHCTLAVLNAARMAAFAAAVLYSTNRGQLRRKRDALYQVRDEARAFATLARDILKAIFGSSPDERWQAVGFVDSMAIPPNVDDLLILLRTMAAFFAANASLENGPLNITAVRAEALANALEAAIGEVTTQETNLEMIKNDRDAKFVVLRGRLVQLVDELKHLIDPLDPRWIAFGFNKPGAKQTPEQVEGVEVKLVTPTKAEVKWPSPPRARYFRVWRKVVDVDSEPVAVGSPTDPDFMLEDLPPGRQIEVYVSAVNDGGEGARSQKVVVSTEERVAQTKDGIHTASTGLG